MLYIFNIFDLISIRSYLFFPKFQVEKIQFFENEIFFSEEEIFFIKKMFDLDIISFQIILHPDKKMSILFKTNLGSFFYKYKKKEDEIYIKNINLTNNEINFPEIEKVIYTSILIKLIFEEKKINSLEKVEKILTKNKEINHLIKDNNLSFFQKYQKILKLIDEII